jgi:hypothetical protein
MKDHQRAEFTNKLRDAAIKYQGTQQLRSRLAAVVDECIPKDKNILNRFIEGDGNRIVELYESDLNQLLTERDALQATVKELKAKLEEERQENASLRSGDDYERGAE